MSIPTVKLLALAALATCLAGCGFYSDEEQAEYDRVHTATREVISKYFTVRDSEFIEGHLIAYSNSSNQFGEQQRYKIDAWVDRETEGFFVPRVQVMEQMNMSVAVANRNSRGQDNPAWRNVAFNRKLETQLTNEIQDVLGGYTGSASADWFNADLALIERQKKIQEARAGYRAREAGTQPAPPPGQ